MNVDRAQQALMLQSLVVGCSSLAALGAVCYGMSLQQRYQRRVRRVGKRKYGTVITSTGLQKKRQAVFVYAAGIQMVEPGHRLFCL